MKICYVNPTILMRRPIAEIIDRLGDKHELSLLMPRKKGKRLDSSLHYSKIRKAKIISYPIIQAPGNYEWPIPGFKFLRQAWRILKSNDVIHMWVPFYLNTSALAILKGLFFKKKKLILTMDTIPGYSFKLSGILDIFFKIYYKSLGKIVFSCADEISLYGESLIKYAKQAGMPIKKVKITPTGVNSKLKPKDKDIRKELGIKKDEKIALFIGLLVPRKGIDLIIKTAGKLRDEKIKFILVGDGPNRKQYEQIAKKLKLDNIVFTGFRKDVYNFYRQADVFFFPSRGEGLAGVIMESMVYGLPIISSRIPCTEDLIKHKESGFLCPIESVDCYAQLTRILLDNKRLRNKFIQKSKKKIKKEYGWRGNLINFERMYK